MKQEAQDLYNKIQSAFEDLEFCEGIEVVDKLKLSDIEEAGPGMRRYLCTCLAKDEDSSTSFKVSVHVLIDSKGCVDDAYAYDTRTGNEIASLWGAEEE